MLVRLRLLPSICLVALAACASVPKTPPPAIARRADGAAIPRTDPAARWPVSGWWRGWGDPQLDALMAEALAGSPDVARAAARLRQAEAVAQESGADNRLSVTADGSAGVTRQSYNLGIPREFVPKGFQDTGRIALSARLDLDLWGRNRAALAAATSEAVAARVDADQAALTLTTAIADAYARLAMLYADRDVAAAAIRVRQDSGRLVSDRAANGLENQGELRLAEGVVASARADFYPDISLSALIGLQSLGLGRLVEQGSTIGSAGPAFTLPIFDGGRLRARYRQADAAYDGAIAAYDATLLAALQEVADAAAGLDAVDVRIADQDAAVKAAEAAYSIARQRYEGGLSTRLALLSAEDRLLARRRLLTDTRARALQLDIALVRALGGGYREGQ